MANEIKRCLLRDVIRDLVTRYVYRDAKFKMAERCHAFLGLDLAKYISSEHSMFAIKPEVVLKRVLSSENGLMYIKKSFDKC